MYWNYREEIITPAVSFVQRSILYNVAGKSTIRGSAQHSTQSIHYKV